MCTENKIRLDWDGFCYMGHCAAGKTEMNLILLFTFQMYKIRTKPNMCQAK